MSTYLRKKREQAGPDYQPRTWAWVKSCWRPVKDYRFIKRGKRVGRVKVELFYPEGKTITIPATHMKFARNSQKVEKNSEK